MRFGDQMAVLPTKTKPKKLLLYGSDGKEYNYLLKGREDLHLDERIMQFLRVVNGMLKDDRNTRSFASLRARHYAVLPLGPRSGLIQWVDNVTPLYSLYKSWQLRTHANTALREKGADAELVNQSTAASRPAEAFFAKLTPALKSKGLSPSTPRKDWPHDMLRRVLQELVAETPRDLLAAELWCQSADTNEWWLKTQSFVRSSAVMSMLGYVIGLGDRHLDNILLDLRSGEMLHIDYNVCFEKGLRLKVPETVPFRMTHTMQAALGVSGTDGAFTSCCEGVLRVLRHSKETLLTLLEAFVYDPLVDWAADREGAEQRKGAELNVSLSLGVSRIDELQSPLRQWEAQLLGAAKNFCKPLVGLFAKREALALQQVRHAELLQQGTVAVEQEEQLQGRRNAALLALANIEEPLEVARKVRAMDITCASHAHHTSITRPPHAH